MKAITTTYHAATSTLPARIIATANDCPRVTISRHAFDEVEQAHRGAAIAFCERFGWTGKMMGGNLDNNSMVWVWFDTRPDNNIDL